MHDIERPFFYVPYFSDGSDEKSCEKVDIPSKEILIWKHSQKCKKKHIYAKVQYMVIWLEKYSNTKIHEIFLASSRFQVREFGSKNINKKEEIQKFS